MNKFKLVIFESNPSRIDSLKFTYYAKEWLEKAVREVNSGNNKEVERLSLGTSCNMVEVLH